MSPQFELGAKSRRSPIAAAILGLLAPGLGLLYCGKPRPAFTVMAAAILPWLLCALTGNGALKVALVLFYFALYLAQLIWGVALAIKIGESYELQRFNRGLVYVLVFMLFAAYNELDSSYLTQMVPLTTKSMTPAILPDDVVLLSRAAYYIGDPEVGDVVAYLHEPQSQAPFLGRIAALPGDRIELSDGEYRVNGQPLSTPSAASTDGRLVTASALSNLSATEIEPEHYFIVADNQSGGYDSRVCGPVARGQIIGRIDAVLLPGSGGSSRWARKP